MLVWQLQLLFGLYKEYSAKWRVVDNCSSLVVIVEWKRFSYESCEENRLYMWNSMVLK
jgi:hypothetical protein